MTTLSNARKFFDKNRQGIVRLLTRGFEEGPILSRTTQRTAVPIAARTAARTAAPIASRVAESATRTAARTAARVAGGASGGAARVAGGAADSGAGEVTSLVTRAIMDPQAEEKIALITAATVSTIAASLGAFLTEDQLKKIRGKDTTEQWVEDHYDLFINGDTDPVARLHEHGISDKATIDALKLAIGYAATVTEQVFINYAISPITTPLQTFINKGATVNALKEMLGKGLGGLYENYGKYNYRQCIAAVGTAAGLKAFGNMYDAAIAKDQQNKTVKLLFSTASTALLVAMLQFETEISEIKKSKGLSYIKNKSAFFRSMVGRNLMMTLPAAVLTQHPDLVTNILDTISSDQKIQKFVGATTGAVGSTPFEFAKVSAALGHSFQQYANSLFNGAVLGVVSRVASRALANAGRIGAMGALNPYVKKAESAIDKYIENEATSELEDFNDVTKIEELEKMDLKDDRQCQQAAEIIADAANNFKVEEFQLGEIEVERGEERTTEHKNPAENAKTFFQALGVPDKTLKTIFSGQQEVALTVKTDKERASSSAEIAAQKAGGANGFGKETTIVGGGRGGGQAA